MEMMETERIPVSLQVTFVLLVNKFIQTPLCASRRGFSFYRIGLR